MASRTRNVARRITPVRQPAAGPSEDAQFVAFLGFSFLMIALLGACGAFHG